MYPVICVWKIRADSSNTYNVIAIIRFEKYVIILNLCFWQVKNRGLNLCFRLVKKRGLVYLQKNIESYNLNNFKSI